MDEYYIDFFKKIFKILKIVLIILLIIGIVIAGFFGIIKLTEKLKDVQYDAFQKNLNIVTEKIVEIEDLGEQYLGVNIKGKENENIYRAEIDEILHEYSVDITSSDYYLLEDNHKSLMGIENLKDPYIVNYKEGLVFCLNPIEYKGVKYYTLYDVYKTLKKIYSYDFPIVPEGFRHKEGKWNEGYTIIDNNSNEFVWIPLGMLNTENPELAFKKYYITRNIEPEQTNEYISIVDSIKKYGGFYIAKYEASLKGATEFSSEGTKNVLQSVQNVIPVTQLSFSTEIEDKTKITRGYNSAGKSVESREAKGALELAKSMAYDYGWNQQKIYTTLMYAEHYDSTIYLIYNLGLLKDRKIDNLDPVIQDSSAWGNYTNSIFRYSFNDQLIEKTKEKGILLPTGAYYYKLDEDVVSGMNKVFNICDLVGNVSEWTMQGVDDDYRYTRGGNYGSLGSDCNASKYVKENEEFASAMLGLRVVLYIM